LRLRLEAKMNLAKPLILALGGLLVGKMLSGRGTPSARQGEGVDAGGIPSDGGLAGGIGGLLEKLQSAGHGDVAKSWLGPGQNQPIEPGQLGSALGQKAVSDLAQHAGLTEQDLLSQLSQNLPQFVDTLTPGGRIPSLQEIVSALSQKQGAP
jgi:uncharacterized protein YidB (DUF937 family)